MKNYSTPEITLVRIESVDTATVSFGQLHGEGTDLPIEW